MTDFTVNFNAGYAPVQNNTPKTAAGETNAGETEINKYDDLLLWQGIIQSSIDENVYQEMATTYAYLADTDEWDAKVEELIQLGIDIADESTPYTFTEEGKSYGESLETLAQQHIEAYDIFDKDNKITFEEYKQSAILEDNVFLSEGETPITEDNEVAMQMYEASFNFMDFNDDNIIDKDEMKTYYITADMFDSIADPPENPEDMMDGKIKFSTLTIMNDIMGYDAPEGSEEAADKEELRNVMKEIYEQNKTPEKPELPKAKEPSTKGKMVSNIEKNLLKKNPFKKQDE